MKTVRASEYNSLKEALEAVVKNTVSEMHRHFIEHYDRLYELADQGLVPNDYNFMIDQYEKKFAENDFEFILMVRVFNAYRGDFISSDREVASFMYALMDTIAAEQEQEQEQQTA